MMNLILIGAIFVVLGLWYLLFRYFIRRSDKTMDEYDKNVDKAIKGAFKPLEDIERHIKSLEKKP